MQFTWLMMGLGFYYKLFSLSSVERNKYGYQRELVSFCGKLKLVTAQLMRQSLGGIIKTMTKPKYSHTIWNYLGAIFGGIATILFFVYGVKLGVIISFLSIVFYYVALFVYVRHKNAEINSKQDDIKIEITPEQTRLLINLSGGEKHVLRQYFHIDQKSLEFPVYDSNLDELVRKKVLYKPTDIKYALGITYTINEWAWGYLKCNKKLLR